MNAVDAIAAWVEAGRARPIDRALVQMLARHAPDADPRVLLAAGLASAGLAEGHTGWALSPRDEDAALPWPEGDDLVGLISAASCVGEGREPFVWRGGLLQTARMAGAEAAVASMIAARAAVSVPVADEAALTRRVHEVFGERSDPEQEAAVAGATRQRLSVLVGGPGTGKTTTVVRLLAVLLDAAAQRGEGMPGVRLLAPTGKAAARLAASVRAQKEGLPVSAEVRAAIPDEAATIHRALGALDRSLTRFRHGPERPWAERIVVVDEVSMVDLPLMERLLGAVAPDATLVLVGDAGQLPSVGPGAVLRDVCALPADHPVGRRVLALTTPKRYSKEIGALASALRAGDGAAALRAVHSGAPVVGLRGVDARGTEVVAAAARAAEALHAARDPEALLDALDAHRLLTPTRVGPLGVEALNAAIEARLLRGGSVGPWYAGRPILILANDPVVGLFNGDNGVIGWDGRSLVAWFRDGQGPRAVPLGRLPAHETAYAMTIHKSQGSEFQTVDVVLGEGRMLSRQLIYTAITRAKGAVRLWGEPETLVAAAGREEARRTGLRAAWG